MGQVIMETGSLHDITTPTVNTTVATCDAIYVGTSGDLNIDLVDGGTITIPSLAAGVFHRIKATGYNSSGTTATDIRFGYFREQS